MTLQARKPTKQTKKRTENVTDTELAEFKTSNYIVEIRTINHFRNENITVKTKTKLSIPTETFTDDQTPLLRNTDLAGNASVSPRKG